MRYSKIFTRSSKQFPKEEVSISSQLLIKGGFIDKVAAGIYTLLPFGLSVANKISQIIRDEMIKAGGQEVSMPGLIPKENWVATGRWSDLDVLFKTSGQDKKEYALGASHEEIVSPLAKKFTFSYKDLPFAIFQIQNKFRNELRAKSGILRTREFLMKDLYSFHADEADLDKYYDQMIDHYWRIFERVGIKDKTYLVYASGGTFSKFSHEFQTTTEAGEDEIYVCKKCSAGLNKEILQEAFKCPCCESVDYEVKKVIEVGNIFKIKTKYSEPFSLDFVDKDDKRQPVIMGCYGIGIQRLMGAVVEVSHDEKGIVWPQSIAPFKVYLIATPENKDEAEKLYKELIDKDIEVLYDDREVGIGEKFTDADLIGSPYRIVMSPRNNGKIELKRRSQQEPKILEKEELLKILS
ncbi:hypothetical protein COT77_03105 [Candidatus Berkelbacteria bacterium CG10_big_fil_rev_8_21_14_0_10_41_12]|uniref:Proline--tRNA ligase n=1 Tax=Candidatus Berkelbacteria bacterium CG10_big_fil_rev_8_21_14_0_10_41_12 TaxID=1974513 RepID=A0A2M6WWF5_9BACT|nr:MAG: hypothetical protein COT77_03105 [Candidatus Berkelbacteria bacterium CG10_big_fil_rev_8_21_14_0_10_41_12]